MIDSWLDTEQLCIGRLWAEEGPGKDGGPLPSWLLTTADWTVAQAVADAYGTGEPQQREGGSGFEVGFECDIITVAVPDPGSVVNRLVQGEGGAVTHVCDGERFLQPMSEAGHPCGCAGIIRDRKAMARSGEGPTPDCRVVFRLAKAPEIGIFCFMSRSWEFAESLNAISDVPDGGSWDKLDLNRRTHRMTTRSGVEVAFTVPIASPFLDNTCRDAVMLSA